MPSPHPALDNAPPTEDTSAMPNPTPPANCGRMIVTLTRNALGRAVPSVTFDPVGEFTPGLVHFHTLHFAQAVHKAQVSARNEQTNDSKAATALLKRIEA